MLSHRNSAKNSEYFLCTSSPSCSLQTMVKIRSDGRLCFEIETTRNVVCPPFGRNLKKTIKEVTWLIYTVRNRHSSSGV